MPDNVSDISHESALSRAIRSDSLAGMMLVVVLIGMMTGVVMGLCISQLIIAGEKYDEMRSAYENSSTWHSVVGARIKEHGIKVPHYPETEEDDQ